MLSELEQKLLRLALDKAATQGEVRNCAIKLIEQWRKAGKTPEEILGIPDYGLCVIPFGKYKGKKFRDIDPNYLRWLAQDMKINGTKSIDILKDIELFIKTKELITMESTNDDF